MMSASEGGGGSLKSGFGIKEGCMNFILQISSQCGQGGRGSKNPDILGTSYLEAPNDGDSEEYVDSNKNRRFGLFRRWADAFLKLGNL